VENKMKLVASCNLQVQQREREREEIQRENQQHFYAFLRKITRALMDLSTSGAHRN
jgi:hypothetical protein